MADALGLAKRQVDGILQQFNVKRIRFVVLPAEVELEDGTHKTC